MSVFAAQYTERGKFIEVAVDSYGSYGNQMQTFSNKIRSFKTFIFAHIGGWTNKTSFYDFMEQRKGRNPALKNRKAVFKLMADYRKFLKDHHIDPNRSSTFLIVCKAGIFTYDTDDCGLNEWPNHCCDGWGQNSVVILMKIGKRPHEAIQLCLDDIQNIEGPVLSMTFDAVKGEVVNALEEG